MSFEPTDQGLDRQVPRIQVAGLVSLDRSVKGICAGQNRVDRMFAQERRLGPAVEFAQ